MPTRRQAIIWTNDGLVTDAYMRHSASMTNVNINTVKIFCVNITRDLMVYYWTWFIVNMESLGYIWNIMVFVYFAWLRLFLANPISRWTDIGSVIELLYKAHDPSKTFRNTHESLCNLLESNTRLVFVNNPTWPMTSNRWAFVYDYNPWVPVLIKQVTW